MYLPIVRIQREGLLLLALLIWSGFIPQAACAQEEEQLIPACIGFYNLENLFDTIDSPDTDDAEFLPQGPKLWGSERYLRKLNKMAKVISDL